MSLDAARLGPMANAIRALSYIEYGCVIVGDWYLFHPLGTWRFEGGEAVGGAALKQLKRKDVFRTFLIS